MPTTVATLNIIVKFDELPNNEDLERIVDEARSYGRVTYATLEIVAETKKEFV